MNLLTFPSYNILISLIYFVFYFPIFLLSSPFLLFFIFNYFPFFYSSLFSTFLTSFIFFYIFCLCDPLYLSYSDFLPTFCFRVRTAMNRENVLKIVDELRLLFAARRGSRLTAGQIRQIVTSTSNQTDR